MLQKYRLYPILVLSLLVRLPNINAPIIGMHSWRQADTAAMARNYVETDGSFAYSRVDWEGYKVVESEFPIYQYIVSLLYRLFGIHEFIGRITSIISSILTLLFFYLLVRHLTNDLIAFWSTLTLSLLLLQIFYSRVFMPEPTMIMFTILGILLLLKWHENNSVIALCGSAIAIALACLMKITSLYLGILLAYLFYDKYG